MRLPLIAACAIAIAIAPAAARTPSNSKAEVAKALTRQLKGDFSKHSQAKIYAAIKPVDINSDGIQDWQVNWNAFGSAWCGTGGCRYQLWLGRKIGAPVRVFDRQMRELEIVKRAGRTVFVFDFHGSECGGVGADACPGEFAWSKRRGRMLLLPSPKKHTSVTDPIETL
ncbi:MAG: hypothetical protein ABL912_14195 [Novosphingobium sp.]